MKPAKKTNRDDKSKNDKFIFIWIGLFSISIFYPVRALLKLSESVPLKFILVYVLVINLITFYFYKLDKGSAEKQKWRIPEINLHLLELSGGWLFAFWAQRILRHKIRKVPFQIIFWIIIILHQLLALDYLNGWYFGRSFLDLFKN